MSEILLQTVDRTTQGTNLDMKKNANLFLSMEFCESMAGVFPRTRIEIRPGDELVDYFEIGPLPIVSASLKELLEEFLAKAEFFPVTILRTGKKYTEKSFYFCNILDLVDCLDQERGKYKIITLAHLPRPRVNEINKLAIDEAKADGHSLFRIADGGEDLICVSDELAARVKSGGFSGVTFVTPAKWRFGMYAYSNK